MYVKSQLSAFHLPDLDNSNVESIYIRVRQKQLTCIFGVCYRPPGQWRIYLLLRGGRAKQISRGRRAVKFTYLLN